MHVARIAPVFSRSFASALFLTALVGCSSDPAPDASTPVDAATDTTPQDATPDTAPVDVPPPQMSQIFGPCRADTECAVGLSCRTETATGYPGGECNTVCTSDEDCVLIPEDGSPPIDGWCPPAVGTAPRYCQRVWASGIACERAGYTCRTYNAGTLTETKACIPVCTDESCVNGTVCDHDSGRCRAMGTTPTGRTLGQSCQPEMRTGAPTPPADQICRSGLCQADWSPDSRGNRFYTGWNGGYCISRCILPQGYNSSTFWGEAGMTVPLPQGTCPTGGICLPGNSYARGDLGTCYKGCTTNDDCRPMEGYQCQRQIQLTQTTTRRFANGFCVPVNCLNTATPCPSGLTCRRNANGSGSCIPEMTASP